ncbi:MAG: glycosyltransferase [Longimonas sp.]|uniref:glycosyltransferase family 2 protein n=1 Tax=Longimonas sp. TaxID=2039626 RepID=UPI0033550DFE
MNPPFAVHHVDMEHPPEALPRLSGSDGAYVVFWAHGIPLGHRLIPSSALPMSPAMLRAYAYPAIAPAVAHYNEQTANLRSTTDTIYTNTIDTDTIDTNTLSAIKHLLQNPSRLTSKPRYTSTDASVVICTRDRPEHLAACLHAIAALTPAPAEVIVVDNAPQTDATRRLVATRPGVRYVHEPRPGLDIARNTGVRTSTKPIIAFTDDDVRVDPQWLRYLCAGFDAPDVMAVTGLVLPATLDTESQYLFEIHWGFHRGYLPRRFDAAYMKAHRSRCVPVWDVGAGASMAFRRDAFMHVGGFDERLDVGAAGCSGDSEFWYRLLANGWTCHYTPMAVAHHTHRATAIGLRRQLEAYMRGHTAALLVQYERHGHPGLLRRLFVSLPKYYLRRLVAGALHGYQGRYQTLAAEIRGALSGVLFYLRTPAASPAHPFTGVETGAEAGPVAEHPAPAKSASQAT